MTSKKRILFLSNSYPATVSGVTTVVTNLLTWMSDYYEVGVICPNTSPRFAKRVIGGITHYFLPSYPTLIRKDVRFITPYPIKLQKAFSDFRPVIVHLHDPSPASIVLKDLAVRHNIPVIFSHHFTPQMVLGYLPESLKSLAQNNDNLNNAILQLTCRMYENAVHIIVPTSTIKKTLTPFTSIPISVISSGIDCSLFRASDSSQIAAFTRKYKLPTLPFAFYLGRLDPDKNLPLLIEAWSHIAKKSQNYRLVIAGDGGSAGRLRELAATLGISSQIIWTGHIPPQDLSLLYSNPQAKVFAIPSPIESQSIVTLMAAAAGLPIVAAMAGALPEIVHDSRNGFLCLPAKSTAFANKILWLLQNPDQASLMGKAGIQIAAKHDFPGIITKYTNLYEKITFK